MTRTKAVLSIIAGLFLIPAIVIGALYETGTTDSTLTTYPLYIKADGSSYSTAINHGTLSNNIVLTLPNYTGTFALLQSPAFTTPSLGGAVATTINGLALSLGVNSLADNVAVGALALAGNNSSLGRNTAVGYEDLKANTSGYANVATGYDGLLSNTTGFSNTACGYASLASNIIGNYNTSVGNQSGFSALGNGNVFLGYLAGSYETGSNAFYVDNRDRVNTAGDKAGALLYGTFSTTPANQTLRTNSDFYALGNVSALSFTDRTPSFSGNALAEIMKISNDKDGNIDHNSLPNFAKKTLTEKEITTEGNGSTTKEIVKITGSHTERDLGAMITLLTQAIQEMQVEIDLLKK